MKRRLFGCLVLTGVIWCLISGMAGIKGVSPVVSDNVGAQNYDGGTAGRCGLISSQDAGGL